MRRFFFTFTLIFYSTAFSYAQSKVDSILTRFKTDFPFYNMKDTERYRTTKLIAPSILISAGLAMNSNHRESIKYEIVEERNEHFHAFRTYVDDYLQFTPIAAAYGLDAIGIPSKNPLFDRTAILIKGETVMFLTTQIMKRGIGQRRPDGSNNFSFPSGHTAQAFASATFLTEEYGYRYPWMPYAAYGVASSVGAFRMINNKHFVSDVLVGAAIGILAMKASYWTHRLLNHKRIKLLN